MTRISDENLTPRVDQAICDEKEEQPDNIKDDHVEVAKNYAEPEEPKEPEHAPEAPKEEEPLPAAVQPAEEI